MKHISSAITLDCPNIPILPQSSTTLVPYGQFVDLENQFDPDVASVKSREMYLPSFSIREFMGTFSRDVIFRNLSAHGTELPGSCLLLKANVTTFLTGHKYVAESHQKSQNFKYDPNNEYL